MFLLQVVLDKSVCLKALNVNVNLTLREEGTWFMLLIPAVTPAVVREGITL